jgi:2-oxoglutarate dehydrogenase E2 component (dihydrolipoamide succinyltransferase)
MKLEVRVPVLSDSVASGTLLPWHKHVGETVTRDETLVDLETDKVILEIPAPASGILVELRQPEGAVVKADEVVAVIETGEGVAVAAPSEKPAQPTPAAPVTPAVVSRPAPEQKPGAPLAAASAVPIVPQGENRREPMSRLRQRVAERLVAAQHTAAMLTTFNEVNMQPVNELRQRFKAEFEVRHGVKLGYMSFFVRAVCAAMQQFPVVNAAIDGNDIVWHGDVDIGIAISSPRGLVVPILRRAQTLSSAEIEVAIADFARRARDAKLTLEDLSGGTFSITNGGVFGSLLSTPILNPPQSAILGMHTIQERPVAEHGQVVIRPMMYVALTYDHRLIDGRDAVQFLVALKAALEAPETLLEAT